MFGRSFELFRLFGFPIRVDLSWFVILAVVTFSLGAPEYGLFARQYGELPPPVLWTMGLTAALGLFASIVLHELGHALMARRCGMPMGGITLFIFGGVAEMNAESPSAKAEFLVAVAGPIVSVALALACWGVTHLGLSVGWPTTVTGIIWYLGLINAVVVVFNMIPAFPLDGGRVLRAALWHFRGSLRWATQITSQIGAGFGLALIVLGVLVILSAGALLQGLWWMLLGFFLRNAASMGYQQLLVRRALEGEPVRRFMVDEVDTVAPDATVRQLVENHIYRTYHTVYPIVRGGRPVGCVNAHRIKQLPFEQWDTTRLESIAEPCGERNTIGPDADAMDALARMNQSGASRLMVVEGGRLVGILSLKDLMQFISLKVDLETSRE